MKAGSRFLASLVSAGIVLTLLGGAALAGTETVTRRQSTVAQGELYCWVTCEQERLGLCVYAGTDAEAGFRVQIAQSRLDEAVQLVAQERFAEANSALEQYRTQMQATDRAMVSIRERAASEIEAGSSAGSGSAGNELAARTGWLSPGEIISRVEQRTRTQLQTLDRLCTQSRDQVREQARLALEECSRACVMSQSGRTTTVSDQGSASGQSDQPQGTPVSSGQKTQTQQETRAQEQNQTSEQNQGEDQLLDQEQNQTREQQQQQNQQQVQQHSPQDQSSSPRQEDLSPQAR